LNCRDYKPQLFKVTTATLRGGMSTVKETPPADGVRGRAADCSWDRDLRVAIWRGVGYTGDPMATHACSKGGGGRRQRTQSAAHTVVNTTQACPG
jgi:hypothetical protein